MTARLDLELVARGLARSRSHAARLIRDGKVHVDGSVAQKAAEPVSEAATIAVDDAVWVSRAAEKLVAALAAFEVDPAGRVALDVGASTGGFTQVLLAGGAAHVTALDVGHDQFALPHDDRVTLMEGVNVRFLDALPGPRPDLVTIDVSFISLRHVIGPVRSVTAEHADWMVLVKPQFEVGRTGVREGIVVDVALREQALGTALEAAWQHGLGVVGITASPLNGTHGNAEYLAHLRHGGAHPAEWASVMEQLAKGSA